MPSRIAAGVFFIVVVSTGSELITSPLVDAAPQASSVSPAQRSERVDGFVDTASTAVEEIDTSDAVDSYGNEVTRAVATYRFDATGSLYELHSPRTEVPRLPAPKS